MGNKKDQMLVSWVGGNDLKALDDTAGSLGPVASALDALTFDAVELLYNYPEAEVKPYLEWLSGRTQSKINAHKVKLISPVDYDSVYQVSSQHLQNLSATKANLSILLSPGTPTMQAVWVLLGKTRYPCRFYQSSREAGVEEIKIPFQLSAEYIPTASSLDSAKISQLAQGDAPVDAAFDHIVTQSPRMQTLKAQAQILAEREVPVLIYGETGTGKELFARAIHNASARKGKPFVALNCGAIPPELVDSVLFGHKKGAFTGATSDKPGVFAEAHGGTLFLDEFGELLPVVQVRLLRVLQEHTFVPVGDTKEQKTDIRLITATHRNLMEAVVEGEFREDLFYRIAVGVLHLPPLREREGDLSLLADALLKALTEQDSLLQGKIISPEAKNIILKHPWRGNVRELQSSLLRAALWSVGDAITADEIRQALFQMPENDTGLQNRDVAQGVDIQALMGDLAAEYIRKALAHTSQNKTQAAELLGLKNYQTLNNWIEKYGVD